MGPRAGLERRKSSSPPGFFFKYALIDSSVHKLQRLHGGYLSNIMLTDYCPCVSDCIARCVTLGP